MLGYTLRGMMKLAPGSKGREGKNLEEEFNKDPEFNQKPVFDLVFHFF